jgi:transcriptional regulator with XRE-family HTH domain
MTDHVSDGPIDRLVKARWLAIGLSQSDLAEVLSAALKPRFEEGSRSERADSSRMRQIADALEVPTELLRNASESARRAAAPEHDPLQSLLDLRLLRAFRELQDHRTKETLIHLAEQMVRRQLNRNDPDY